MVSDLHLLLAVSLALSWLFTLLGGCPLDRRDVFPLVSELLRFDPDHGLGPIHPQRVDRRIEYCCRVALLGLEERVDSVAFQPGLQRFRAVVPPCSRSFAGRRFDLDRTVVRTDLEPCVLRCQDGVVGVGGGVVDYPCELLGDPFELSRVLPVLRPGLLVVDEPYIDSESCNNTNLHCIF